MPLPHCLPCLAPQTLRSIDVLFHTQEAESKALSQDCSVRFRVTLGPRFHESSSFVYISHAHFQSNPTVFPLVLSG